MAANTIKFRAYAHTYAQFERLSSGAGQIAVVFATDTGGNGNFQADFNVTPQQIHDFKSKNKNFKFFLSMGGYPFNLAPANVAEAVNSLTDLIGSYGFDGIDVYYDQIPVPPAHFVDVMQSVIRGLKNKNPSLEVSLTVPPPLSQNHYLPLYNQVNDLVNYVIYQTYLLEHPVKDVGQLVRIVDDLPYPAGKLFAGYSFFISDCNTVPPLIFLVACIVLLIQGRIIGISVWAASVI
ncbi:uncharacterized protein LOC114760177 [Neltuma alba]|uniref:uncharacterized protein LOC114760177 n=1 Tax=Neltuma alba TaxID=207710 RepID=UPI0010A440FF|nr:uncharacterized protein LOC114760177 [Prosopis alba]